MRVNTGTMKICLCKSASSSTSSSTKDPHFSNAIEEELDEGVEQEACQQVGICVSLAMDVRPQEQSCSDDCHKSHLCIITCFSFSLMSNVFYLLEEPALMSTMQDSYVGQA